MQYYQLENCIQSDYLLEHMRVSLKLQVFVVSALSIHKAPPLLVFPDYVVVPVTFDDEIQVIITLLFQVNLVILLTFNGAIYN
jgi:hypothetical protein